MAAHKLPTVAIVGRPNVGKSALFNRLAARRIAIVHDQPGITRDRLLATCALGDQPFHIFDTGGIIGAGETDLTRDVRQAANAAMDESEVALSTKSMTRSMRIAPTSSRHSALSAPSP